MMGAWLAAALSMQGGTVEGRLKELETALAALEKRQAALKAENDALEKRAESAKAARETWAQQAASGWVKRYAAAVGFGEAQAAELEVLWLSWMREDFASPATAARWTSREEMLKSRLAAEQVSKLARAVREEQEKQAGMSVRSVAQAAKLAPERAAALEKAVLSRLVFAEGALIPQAQGSRPDVLAALEQALPGLAGSLSEEELARVRDLLAASHLDGPSRNNSR